MFSSSFVNIKNRAKISRTFLCASLLSLCACVYAQDGNRFDMDKASNLKPGISTEDDAKRLLGEPMSVTDNPANGHQLLVWQYVYGTAIGVGGGAKLAISFDRDKKMLQVIQKTQL